MCSKCVGVIVLAVLAVFSVNIAYAFETSQLEWDAGVSVKLVREQVFYYNGILLRLWRSLPLWNQRGIQKNLRNL